MLETEQETPETVAADSSAQSTLLRIAKEPLLHFMLVGAAIYMLFALYGQQGSDDAIAEQNTIVVTNGEIKWLAEMWQKRWNRPPTDEEMAGLVKEHVKETVLYREAIAMGLDKDDTIIRRRLKQKLEFLAQDLIQPKPPTEDELQAYFKEHVDRYRTADLLTFSHVFLDPDKRGDHTLTDAEKLKTELIASAKTPDASSDLGDRFMLQSYYPERSEADVSKLFGSEFRGGVAHHFEDFAIHDRGKHRKLGPFSPDLDGLPGRGLQPRLCDLSETLHAESK
jgi:peptidyl-prolyl cis-trans isomerase C